jgi:transposase-like protein
MGRGRPPAGPGQVERLEGVPEGKRRLRVILEVTAGAMRVKEACRQLGVSETRFHVLRRQALEGALGALAPAPAGRPRRAESVDTSRVAELEQQVRELRVELHTALVRTEVALAMPHLLKGKKGTQRERSKKNAAGRGTSRGSKR